jgi:branched-chain amino acid transport system substrate-binding protein
MTVMRRAAAIATALLVLGFTACGTDEEGGGAAGGGGEQGEIKLGLIVPLTGALAQPGGWIETAVEFSVDEINKGGGIDGRQVRVITFDDAADPTQTVTGANKLISQDKVDFVIGPITTDGMKAILPLETRQKVPAVGVVGSPSLTVDEMPYGFSVLLNAGDQATKMVEYAAGQGGKRVAILHDSGEQGRTASEVLKEQAAAAGLEVTGTQQYDVGDADMTAQLLSLKRGRPDQLLLYPTSGEDVGNVLKGMEQLKWDLPVVGGYAAHYADAIVSVSGKDSLEGLIATAYTPFGACPDEGVPETTQTFIDDLEAFDADRAKGISLDLAASVRDGVWIMKAAIEGAGSTDGDAVAKWLEENSSSLGEGLVNQAVSASSDSHFVFGPDAMVLVEPAEEVSPGIYARVDC